MTTSAAQEARVRAKSCPTFCGNVVSQLPITVRFLEMGVLEAPERQQGTIKSDTTMIDRKEILGEKGAASAGRRIELG